MKEVANYWILFYIVGFVFGVLAATVFFFRRINAIMHIDTRNPEKDKFNLIVLDPIDNLEKKKFMLVQIKKTE